MNPHGVNLHHGSPHDCVVGLSALHHQFLMLPPLALPHRNAYPACMEAWNGWYHVTTSTYGTWLPGDPRGWRERHHRKHVEGDYKNPPPPGTGDALHRYAQSQMKHPPVRLTPSRRAVVGNAMVEMLVHQGIEVLALSMDAVHCHLLAKFPADHVRALVGRAKKHAAFQLRACGHTGKLWERFSHAAPIADRAHEVTAFRYIGNHTEKGVWAWTFRDDGDGR